MSTPYLLAEITVLTFKGVQILRTGLKISTLLLAGAVALSGCGDDAADNGDNGVQPNANGADGVGTNNLRIVDGRGNGGNNGAGAHANSRMEMSQRIADRLATMAGVDAAYVMLMNRNAYVAIMQDRQGANGSRANGNNNKSRSQGRSGSKSTANAGGGKGADVTADLKDRIANQVKAMSPSTENVYVTANPDFVTHMQNYARDIGNGHPIRGLVDEFNSLVGRIFPAASGTNGTDGGRAGTSGGSRTSGIGGLND